MNWCGDDCRPVWPLSSEISIPLECRGDPVERLVASALDRSGWLFYYAWCSDIGDPGIRGRYLVLCTRRHAGLIIVPYDPNAPLLGIAAPLPNACTCRATARELVRRERNAITLRLDWERFVRSCVLERVCEDDFKPPYPKFPARHEATADGICVHFTVSETPWAPSSTRDKWINSIRR